MSLQVSGGQHARRTRWAIVWATGVALALAGFAFHFERARGASSSPPRERITPVVVATVEHRDIPIELAGVGSVEAYYQVTVKPRINGQITELDFTDEDIAHDLRTPLTRLRARIERVLEALPSTGEATASLSLAIEDIDQVLVTIKAILRIAEVEHGQRRGAFRDVDLYDVLQEAVDLYEPIAEAKGIDLILRETRGGSTRGDADLLFEAVSNLLDNAIKFTPPSGSVEVSLQQESRGPSIRVSDTGPGIAPEDFPKLLRRFQRGDGSRGTPGTGLGLSLVAAIARLHGFALAQRPAQQGCCIELQCWPRESLSMPGSDSS